MFIPWIVQLVVNFKRQVCGEATERDVEEYLAERRREEENSRRQDQEDEVLRLAEEARFAAAAAAHEQENRKLLEECAANEFAQEEREIRDQEWEEEQSRYRSHCPFCGSPIVLSRCRACDNEFGRN